MNYPKIILHPGKELSLKRKHLWVFSGAIKKIISPQGKVIELKEGEVAEVVSAQNKYLATGHYQKGSISVRIISFDRTEIDSAFLKGKIRDAFNYRTLLGFNAIQLGIKSDGILDGQIRNSEKTNVFRLVNAEGDGMPGLIIDYYSGTAVIQSHSIGMHNIRKEIAEALRNVCSEFDLALSAIYDKSSEAIAGKEDLNAENAYLLKDSEPNKIITENNCEFFVDWETGQKTGFFIDQRENRNLLTQYVKDKIVLNAFCYSGGFSVYALKAGAKEVHSLDSSKKAMELTERNVSLNGTFEGIHKSITDDALDYLKSAAMSKEDGSSLYDVIILDPPAFAKHLSARHKAVQGYIRLNALALKKIRPGGILFTFSCSQAVDRSLFYNSIVAASIESGRKIKLMHHLSQPPDHPVNIYHPEGEYLKGLVLFVE